MSFMTGDEQKGVSFLSLESGLTRWTSIPNEQTCLWPVVAGNVVAILTNECHTVNGFNASTGQRLWQTQDWSGILDSDGKYLYIEAATENALIALTPDTGTMAWSLRLPYTGYSLYSYHVYEGRLYTAEFVIDLSRRTIIHRWPQDPVVNAMAFGKGGTVYVGDPSGVIRIYNRSFRLLGRVRIGHGHIVGLASAPKGMLAVSYEYRSRTNHSVFRVVTRRGNLKWQLRWESKDLLGAVPFVIAGSNVLLIEPDITGNNYWLTLRDLSTGRITWKVDAGRDPLGLAGPLVLCGDTVYVSSRNSLHSFDVHTGYETVFRGP